MKKGLFSVVIFALPFLLLAEFSPTTWRHIYKSQSSSIKLKRDNLCKISQEATIEFKSLILDILDEQVSYGIERNKSLKGDFEEWIYYGVLTAGKLELKEAVPKMKILFSHVDNPRIKGAILYYIGRTGDRAILPWLNSLMDHYNKVHAMGEIRGKEDIVYGLLRSLEFYRHPSSFHPVFYAAVPNYSERIRETAGKLLEAITDDPAPLCVKIIRTEKNRRLVYQALQYALNSSSDRKTKIETALIALEYGIDKMYTINYQNETVHRSILDLAVKALGDLEAKEPEVVAAINRKWEGDIHFRHQQIVDRASQIINIHSLEKIGTENAIAVLTAKLLYFTEHALIAGDLMEQEKYREILLKIISVLGELGVNMDGIDYNDKTFTTVTALDHVISCGYFGKSVTNEAGLAIDKIINRLQ